MDKDLVTRESPEESPQVCPTVLVEDVPASSDGFKPSGGVGPHGRVAHAIGAMIRSGEAGGKMIGLEGGWGAGKTTVINLVRDELADNRTVQIVSFDAWAHEGDPLRRTYLESLIKNLSSSECGWLAKDTAQKALDELAHRRKTSTTRTIPKTSRFGKWFGATSLAVPIGLVLFKRSLDVGLTFGRNAPISWPFVIGFPLTIAPFIVLLFFLILKTLGKLGEDFEWNLLEGKTSTETTQETTETPQPTSIEFEDRFRELMGEALSKQPERFLTIVLDNLDRVNIKDAQTIWSTLQTFLHGHERDPWFRRLCILVPYDPSGLRQLWERRGDKSEKGEQRAPKSPIDERHGESETVVSDSFIDKSFQLRFEVPPLVLSDWKSYLTTLLSRALPSHSQEDRQLIYNVYGKSRPTERPPTPRELKLYVNQVGAIHRQWQHAVPLGHVAYYASLRRNHRDIPTGLHSGEIPSSAVACLFESDTDLRASLAALHFNVRPEHGTQLLLTAPITDALNGGESEELTRLASLYQDGFWVVLEEIATSHFADMDAVALAKAGACLEKSGLLVDRSRNEAVTVAIRLAIAARRVNLWPLKDLSIFEGVSAICRVAGDISVSKSVAATIRDGVKGGRSMAPDRPTGSLVSHLAKFADELDAIGHAVAVQPFTMPGDADDWIALCPYVMGLSAKRKTSFIPAVSFDDVLDNFGGRVTSGRFSTTDVIALSSTRYAFTGRAWEPLALRIERRIEEGEGRSVQEVDFLLHALAIVIEDGCSEAEAAVGRLADSGWLMHWLQSAQEQDQIGCTTWCIISFLFKRPDGTSARVVGNAADGFRAFVKLLASDNVQLAGHIVELCRRYYPGVIFSTVENLGFGVLITRCLRIIADNVSAEQFFTSENILKHWRKLNEVLPEAEAPQRFEKLITDVCPASELASQIEKSDFKLDDVGLYSAICAAAPPNSFVSWCQHGLQGLETDTWMRELENYDEGLRFALSLLDRSPFTLSISFQDAIIGFARKLAAANVQLQPKLPESWQLVLTLLESPSRAVLPDHLLRDAVPLDGNCSSSFFELFGDEITKDKTKSSYREILPRLLSPIIRHRNIKGLDWLQNLLINDRRVLDNFNSDLVEEFSQRLREEIESSTEDEVHIRIQRISSLLGINAEKAPAEA